MKTLRKHLMSVLLHLALSTSLKRAFMLAGADKNNITCVCVWPDAEMERLTE